MAQVPPVEEKDKRLKLAAEKKTNFKQTFNDGQSEKLMQLWVYIYLLLKRITNLYMCFRFNKDDEIFWMVCTKCYGELQ